VGVAVGEAVGPFDGQDPENKRGGILSVLGFSDENNFKALAPSAATCNLSFATTAFETSK
jgi:hypothetical protein